MFTPSWLRQNKSERRGELGRTISPCPYHIPSQLLRQEQVVTLLARYLSCISGCTYSLIFEFSPSILLTPLPPFKPSQYSFDLFGTNSWTKAINKYTSTRKQKHVCWLNCCRSPDYPAELNGPTELNGPADKTLTNNVRPRFSHWTLEVLRKKKPGSSYNQWGLWGSHLK